MISKSSSSFSEVAKGVLSERTDGVKFCGSFSLSRITTTSKMVSGMILNIFLCLLCR